MTRSEAGVMAAVVLLVATAWLFLGRLPVSAETSTRYQAEGPFLKHWHDGMGSQISVSYLSPEETGESAQRTDWSSWAEDYTVFWLKLQERPGPNFLMVDLPYYEMSLKDDQGREYRLLNQELAGDQELREQLTIFDWTLFNNAFPDGPTLQGNAMQEGPLLFQPLAPDSRQAVLEIKYCMVGKPPWRLTFEFETKTP